MAREESSRLLVWSIVASQFGPPFMFSGVAVALPAMGVDLQAGATSLGLVETLFLAGGASWLLPVGRLADASDRRTLYKLGLLGFGLTSLVIGLLSSTTAILVARFLQGIASATFSVTGAAVLTDIVPAHRRGSVYGAALGAIYAGLALGPVIAGVLCQHWGWRAVFLVGAATVLGAYLLIQLTIASSWRRPERALHLPSVLVLAAAVLGLVIGSATLRQGALGYTLLGAGLVLAIVFVVLQRRVRRPLVDVTALVDNRTLRSALLVQMLVYVNAFASIFLLSIYLQVSLGYSAETSGLVLATGTVLMAAVSPVAGKLADRHQPRLIATAGVALILVCPLLALTLDEGSSLLPVAVLLAAQGLGFGLFSAPNLTTIMSSVGPEAIGRAAALGAKARTLGMVVGMIVTAVLISTGIGNEPVARHPLQYIDIMVTAFALLAALTALALAVSLLAGRRGRRSPSQPSQPSQPPAAPDAGEDPAAS